MNQQDIKNQLQEMFGEHFITDEEVLKERSSDLIGYRRWERFNGAYLAEKPMGVIMAQNTEDVSRALAFCNQNKVLVVPQCGRSCVCSGTETYEGSVVLDGTAMNGILKFDEENYMVTVGCGTPLKYLEEYCNQKGYTTGHFPQSLPLAQMGGLVSTRSIGQLSTLYGGIEDLLIGLEAVLADGSVVRIKNVPRRAAGPDLRHLFMGSEGNIGFVTEVTVKLFKRYPENWMGAFGIDSVKAGLDAIREIMQDGYRPAVVRLHDAVETEMTYKKFINEGESILLFVCEGPESIRNATGAAIMEIVQKHGGRPLGEKPVELWYQVRNDTCDDLYRANKQGLLRDTCETSGNWSDIYSIYENVLKRFPQEIEDVVQISAHSSHSYQTGTNMYFVFSWKGVKDLAKSEQQYDTAMGIIMEETLRFGGSICHHHGVGKYRTKWMDQEHGSSYQMMYTLKDAFDPNGIMNTGTFLPKR